MNENWLYLIIIIMMIIIKRKWYLIFVVDPSHLFFFSKPESPAITGKEILKIDRQSFTP